MQDFQDLKDLAELAGCKVAGISMPGQGGGRPLKFFFVKDSAGELLNDGESMDGVELELFLKARISPETQGKNNEKKFL